MSFNSVANCVSHFANVKLAVFIVQRVQIRHLNADNSNTYGDSLELIF